jgi:hypothetical protein
VQHGEFDRLIDAIVDRGLLIFHFTLYRPSPNAAEPQPQVYQ